jgi:FkbM family methyltransferase
MLSMLAAAIKEREGQCEIDNIDEWYPPFSVGMNRNGLVRRRRAYMDFLSTYRQALFEVLALWEDAASRTLFVQLLLFRALGHKRVRLPSNNAEYWRAFRRAKALPSSPSLLSRASDAATIEHFDVPCGEEAFHVDCLRANVLFTFFLKQYHLARDGIRIGPRPGDHVVDAGACFGDTAVDFSRAVGPTGHVHSFDTVDSHLELLRLNTAQNSGGGAIEVHEYGLSDMERHGVPVRAGVDPGFSVDRNVEVPLRRLDDLVESGRIERVDFLKMDVEGHEAALLRGARATLARFRPRLAISLYHTWDDYHRLPLLVRDLDLGYRFYLDNYTISDGETVMYCVA